MLTSFKREDWREDVNEVWERDRISANSLEPMIRKHYPYQIILKVAGPSYRLRAGDRVQYARVRHTPMQFPIEAVTWGMKGNFRILYFSSLEAQLVEV